MKLPQEPDAWAEVTGNENYPDLQGTVKLYDTYGGSIVCAEFTGVKSRAGEIGDGFFGFHIHEGSTCGSREGESFAEAGGHFNPGDKPHPQHEGDLPPLLVCDGEAWMMFFTGRFFPEDVIGRTAVVHEMPDDFHSQPAGDSGGRIACGQIREWEDK